jgi:membrane-associated phospholipid phosphatase
LVDQADVSACDAADARRRAGGYTHDVGFQRIARPIRRRWGAVALVAFLASLPTGSVEAQTGATPAVPADWVIRAAALPAAAASDAPAYHDYFHALGYSFSRGLFAREQIVPLAIGTAASLALLPVDRKISDAVSGHADNLGRIGNIIGSPLVMGALGGGLMLGSLATDDTRFRSYAFTLSQGLIVAGTLSAVTKVAVRRKRPNGENRWSFPSGHAAGTFALAAVSSHYYGKKAGIPLYALAGTVAFSRVTSGRHFLSDVVAGAAIGYIAGRAAILGTEHVTSAPPSSAAQQVIGIQRMMAMQQTMGAPPGGGLRIHFSF